MAWLSEIGIWLLGKLVMPLLNLIWDGATKQGPKAVQRLRQFFRRKTLELTTSDDEVYVLNLFRGRQWDYQSLIQMSDGRFDPESLLPVVTSLEAKGLLNKPRLEQPPGPRAMFTVTHDATLLLKPTNSNGRLPRRAHRRDADEAVERRARLADDLAAQREYCGSTWAADYVPQDVSDAAAAREQRIRSDQEWLAEHGF